MAPDNSASASLAAVPSLAANIQSAPIMVEVTRGGMVESFHRGIGAIVDGQGKVVRAWGDIDRMIYPRSAIKPLQTIPVIESGAAEKFNLGDDRISLCCASHRAEPMHVDRVVEWLGELGLTPDDFECGPQMPSNLDAAKALIKAGKEPTRAHNNCSGKHSGMLTTAVHLGEPVKGYTGADHPIQTRLINLIGELGREDVSKTARGIDGCGIPVFGMSLKGTAAAMARLADPTGLSEDRQAAIKRIIKSLAAWPKLISGTDTFNSRVLEETGETAILKGGAEGVYTAAVPGLGYGICVKADDGAGRAASVMMGAILRSLGIIDDGMAERLSDHLVPDVTNWAGSLAGVIRPGGEVTF